MTYVGKPLRPFAGAMHPVYGWQDVFRQDIPGIGKRWMANCDVPDLDLVLPYNAAALDRDAHDIAAQASAAWEAAVCWDPSGTDKFAVKRLAEVRAV